MEERKVTEQRKVLLLARRVREGKARAWGRALEDIRWRPGNNEEERREEVGARSVALRII